MLGRMLCSFLILMGLFNVSVEAGMNSQDYLNMLQDFSDSILNESEADRIYNENVEREETRQREFRASLRKEYCSKHLNPMLIKFGNYIYDLKNGIKQLSNKEVNILNRLKSSLDSWKQKFSKVTRSCYLEEDTELFEIEIRKQCSASGEEFSNETYCGYILNGGLNDLLDYMENELMGLEMEFKHKMNSIKNSMKQKEKKGNESLEDKVTSLFDDNELKYNVKYKRLGNSTLLSHKEMTVKVGYCSLVVTDSFSEISKYSTRDLVETTYLKYSEISNISFSKTHEFDNGIQSLLITTVNRNGARHRQLNNDGEIISAHDSSVLRIKLKPKNSRKLQSSLSKYIFELKERSRKNPNCN